MSAVNAPAGSGGETLSSRLAINSFQKWLIALLLWFACPAWAAVQTSLYVTAFTVTTNISGNKSVVFDLFPSGQAEVTPFAPDVVRVRFHFGTLYEREEIAIDKPFSNWPSFNQTFSQPSATNFTITTDHLLVSIVLSNKFQVHFYDTSGYELLRDQKIEFDADYQQLTDTNGYLQIGWPGESTSVSNLPSGFKLRSVKTRATNEAFFGLGDTAGALNRSGRAIQFWAQDTYQFGEGRNPKYTTLPMMYGVRGASTNHPAFTYGLFFNNPARPVFKLYGTNNTWSFEAGDDQLDYFFFGGGTNHTMPGVIDRFSELTGRPVMLPKWAVGYHQSRHSYFTQQRVMEVATGMRSNGFPCDAIYLDIGSQNNFLNGSPSGDSSAQPGQLTFNSNFTNVPGMVQSVGTLGMKLVPLVEPLIATNDPLYPVALSNLYFIKNYDLSTFVGTNFLGRISWLDYSITNTVYWWNGLLTNYLATYGFEGIWNDLNEPNENAMPLDSIWFLDGKYGGGTNVSNTIKWHAINKNTYNIWESRVTYDALREQFPNKRPFVLSRGAWPGIQKYAAGWSGDNKSSFDHLRFNVPMGLNVMISGQAWYGHDVGGFVDDTTPELLTRWIQSGVLNPMFRNHTTLNTIDQEPWVFGGSYTLWNRKWIKFRYEMMPYLYSLIAASTTNGIPVNAPTVFYFSAQDTNTFSRNDNDYMVGRDLLVAPVFTSGDNHRNVYLPAGESWYYWDTQNRYTGGQTVSVAASLGYLPLFSRAGAIIPRGPVQYYANEFAADYLDIHHWPGGTNSFTLYEDDGETTNYLAGVVARTTMTSISATNALAFTIHARTGSYDPGSRDYYLIMYDANPVDDVLVNSNLITRVANRPEAENAAGSAWLYSAVDRKLMVKIPDTGGQQFIEAAFVPFVDSDGDGMPDEWETVFFGGITNGTAGANSDGDSLSNLQEYQAGKNPLVFDTFGSIYTNMAVAGTLNVWNQKADNMHKVGSNRWAYVVDLSGQTNIEFKFVANNDWGSGNWGDNLQSIFVPPMTNQLAFSSGANIQLTGAYEGVFTFSFTETNLRYSVVSSASADSDSDGMSDACEYYYGLNPYSSADAGFDTDRDDFTELQECISGSSLINPESFHSVTNILSGAFSSALIEWLAVTGRQYQVLYSTNLTDAAGWTVLLPYTNLSGNGTISVTDTSTTPFKAYRIDVSNP
jgi:alpha-glucosidase